MLIARALVNGMALLTPDPEIQQYAVRVLWRRFETNGYFATTFRTAFIVFQCPGKVQMMTYCPGVAGALNSNSVSSSSAPAREPHK